MTRSACALDDGRVTVTCHLCDTLVTRGAESAEWEVRWMARCSESLAQLIDIEDFGPVFFDAGHYCSGCMTLIRDVDFSVRASASLASRLLSLKKQIAAFLLSRLSVKAESGGGISQSETVSQGVVKTEGIEDESLDFSSILAPLIGSNTADHETGEIDTESSSSEKVLEAAQVSRMVFPTVQPSSTRVLRSRSKVSYRVDDGVSEVGSDREADNDWSIPNDEDDGDWPIPNDNDGDWSIPNESDGDWSIPNDIQTDTTEEVTEDTSPTPNLKRTNHESAQLGSRAKRTKILVKPNSIAIDSRSAVKAQAKLIRLTEKEFIARMKATSRFCDAPKELESTLNEFVRKNFNPTIFDGHVTQARGRVKGYSNKTGSRTFACTEPGCTYQMNTERLLEVHTLDPHPSSAKVGSARPYLCDLCGKGFKTRLDYNKHPCVNPAHPKCDECGEGFTVPLRLANHTKLKHAHAQLHKCSVCHCAYARTEDVQRHEKLHNAATGFNCVLMSCPTRHFESLEDLRAHVTGPDHDIAQRSLVCDICGKVYKGVLATVNLRHHKYSHGDGGPFKCRFCGKGHPKKLAQVTHEEINHPDLVEKRIYACKQCDATFTVGHYLYSHTAWHRRTVQMPVDQ